MTTQNFKLLGVDLPVGPLLEALADQSHLFEDIPSNLRNTYPGSSHPDTRSILLRWCFPFNEHTVFNELLAVDYPAARWLAREAGPLVSWLADTLGTQEIGRVMINSLRPGGAISLHTDEGAYAAHYDRFHIVVQSRAGNRFTVNGETIEMGVGEAWWFDHRKPHTVTNESDEERVHLIVDIAAPQVRARQ